MVFPYTIRGDLFTVVESLASGFMTWGEIFDYCKPQFPHLKDEYITNTLIGLNSTL